jgi:hypothetical protein
MSIHDGSANRVNEPPSSFGSNVDQIIAFYQEKLGFETQYKEPSAWLAKSHPAPELLPILAEKRPQLWVTSASAPALASRPVYLG